MRINAACNNLATILLLQLFTLLSLPAFSQTQTLDKNFLPKFEKAAVVSSLIKLSDNSVLVVGDITNVGDKTMYSIIKMSEDGIIDPSFVFSERLMGFLSHAAVQTNNKILIAGSFSVGSSPSYRGVMRLNPDGTIDPSFISPIKTGTINKVIIQADGKILITGNFNFNNFTASQSMARLNADGSLDDTFNNEIGYEEPVNDIKLLPDGKIIAAGRFKVINPMHDIIARLNSDGSLDSAFATSFKLSDYENITAIALQANGQILFTTSRVLPAFYYADTSILYGLGKLNTDGSLDETFNNPFKASGAKALTGELNFITLHGDKILVGGQISPSDAPPQQSQLLMQFHADGTIDNTFKSPDQRYNTARCAYVTKDNSIFVGGMVEQVQGQLYNGIIRLSEKGELIADFAPDLRQTPVVGTMIDHIATQQDGKTVVLGSFGFVNGKRVSNIVRLKPDGKTDESFTTTKDATYEYLARFNEVALQGNKILTATKTLHNGAIIEGVVRLNEDGTPDHTFKTTSIGQYYIVAMATQPDHKIVVATYDRLMRLMPDGTIDHDFIQTEHNIRSISALSVQSDGKILVLGILDESEGKSISTIVRLHPDGSVDTSFDARGFKYNSQNYSSSAPTMFDLTVDTKDNIIVTGSFNAYKDNVISKGLMRLKADGSFIGDIPVSYMFTGPLLAVSTTPDNGLLLGGAFRIDNQTYSLIRLTEKSSGQDEDQVSSIFANPYPNPTTDKAEINFSSSYKGYVELRLTDYLGKEIHSAKLLKEGEELNHSVDLSSIKDGLYFLSIISGETIDTKRVLKVSNK